MKLLVVMETLFYKTPEGSYWSKTFDSSYWQQYLETFQEVVVIARTQQVPQAPPNRKLSSHPLVRFVSIPSFSGPRDFMKKLSIIREPIERALQKVDRALIRVPSTLGNFVWNLASKKQGLAVAIEVCGDPRKAIPSSKVSQRVLRSMYTRYLKRQCKKASFVLYSTEQSLHLDFPPGEHAKVLNIADPGLSEQAFAYNKEKNFEQPFRLLHVGSMNHPNEGQETLLKAFDLCVKSGLDAELHLFGNGRYKQAYQHLVAKFGISKQVTFRGALESQEQLEAELVDSHLYIEPAHEEGTTRELLFAMAKGLPCIGSKHLNTSQLLSNKMLVGAKDFTAMFQKIVDTLFDLEELQTQALLNYHVAQGYEKSMIQKKRRYFLEALRSGFAKTEARQRAQASLRVGV